MQYSILRIPARPGKTGCYLTSALVFLLLIACDSARFTGFSYQAEELAKTAPVSGLITNVFTGAPVDSAEVSFDGQVAMTDEFGEFRSHYFLSVDDDANRLVPVTITAEKYFDLDTAVVIFPIANVLNARLTYAAPIVISASVNQSGTASAIVFDYQGAANIDSVFALGWYAPTNGSRINFYSEIQMTFVQQIDFNHAEYSGQLSNEVPNAALLRSRLRIRAKDDDNFEEDTLFLF